MDREIGPCEGPYEAPWWAAQWDVRQLDKTYQRFLQMPGPAISLSIDRGPEQRRRDGADSTFSAEAVDEVLISMRAWLYSRIARGYSDLGHAPQHAEITIEVRLR